MLLLVNLFIC